MTGAPEARAACLPHLPAPGFGLNETALLF
jgi:hypothetical protein